MIFEDVRGYLKDINNR